MDKEDELYRQIDQDINNLFFKTKKVANKKYCYWNISAHETPQELGDFGILVHGGLDQDTIDIISPFFREPIF